MVQFDTTRDTIHCFHLVKQIKPSEETHKGLSQLFKEAFCKQMARITIHGPGKHFILNVMRVSV